MGDDELLRSYLRGQLEDTVAAEIADRAAMDTTMADDLRRLARSEAETWLAQSLDDAAESIRSTVVSSTHSGGLSVASLAAQRLQLGEVLGKGGMGVVQLGTQPHLGRTVAVKRATIDDEERLQALLSEAFVTGQLEHPNIVPIHDIVLGDEREPQVILKRIEGDVWKSLLQDPEEVRRRFEATDTLTWHLRVLMSVCQALRFAHSRGIVHRDVKPSNVMLGRFGEVYLLDWGLAWRVPSQDEPAQRPEDFLHVGGTPAYMAPEQFGIDPIPLGPHTDVYLLGATLFEILEGHPPRSGKSLMRLRKLALAGPPELSADTPPELAAIVNKAMAPSPEERFESVQDVRLAIESYLEHRASRQLADKATASTTAMEAALAAGDDAAAERAFVEATFGYRAALDAWRENHAAERALRELVQRRIEAALDAGAVETAERLLVLEPNVPEALQARVRDAVAEHRRREEALARIEADQDRTAGVGTRRILTLIIFGSWVGWWTYAGTKYPMDPGDMLVGPAAITALGLVLSYAARRRLSSNQNRNLVVVVITLMVGTVSWLGAAASLGLDPVTAPVALLLVWAVATVIGALTIDKRALPAGIVYFAAFYLAASDPTHSRWLLGFTSLFWLANALVVNVLVTREAKARAAGQPTVEA